MTSPLFRRYSAIKRAANEAFSGRGISAQSTTVLRVQMLRIGAKECVKTRRLANRYYHAKLLQDKDFRGFGRENRIVLPS